MYQNVYDYSCSLLWRECVREKMGHADSYYEEHLNESHTTAIPHPLFSSILLYVPLFSSLFFVDHAQVHRHVSSPLRYDPRLWSTHVRQLETDV